MHIVQYDIPLDWYSIRSITKKSYILKVLWEIVLKWRKLRMKNKYLKENWRRKCSKSRKWLYSSMSKRKKKIYWILQCCQGVARNQCIFLYLFQFHSFRQKYINAIELLPNVCIYIPQKIVCNDICMFTSSLKVQKMWFKK